MAPTAPKKRPSLRSKVSASKPTAMQLPAARPGTDLRPSFNSSKRDKRTIKHSSFMNRIEKAYRKPAKRRRPSRKLVTGLGELGDALPDVEKLMNGDGKMRLKSVKVRKGSMKRREAEEKKERERWGRNWEALIAGSDGKQEEKEAKGGMEGFKDGEKVLGGTKARWAALRGFIEKTLEQKEEFVGK